MTRELPKRLRAAQCLVVLFVVLVTSAGGAPASAASWGVDSAGAVTSSFLGQIQSKLGQPAFFGRYLGGPYALQPAEVQLAFSQGISLLLVDDLPTINGTLSGYAAGQSAASTATSNAQSLGVPTGVAIYVDIETNDAVDSGFIEGWYDGLNAAGYVPGYYGNPVHGPFSGAYCGAVAANSAYANSRVWSSEYEPGRTPAASAPSFGPATPPCASNTVLWQYGEPSSDPPGSYCTQTACPNVDTDLAVAGAALWGGGTAPNGSFVQVSGSPAIYRVIGGAAIHVDSCAPLNGCPGLIQIPNLSGYAATPANGSFMRIADGSQAGFIGEAIGGAIVHVDSCAPLSGCPGAVDLDSGGASDYMATYPTPGNGVFVRIQDGPQAGFVGETIGGALIHVDSCGPLGGCPGLVGLDSGGAGDYMATHPTAANGSFMRIADGSQAGFIGEAIGGAIVHVDSCAPLSGCPGAVDLDSGGASDYMATYPTPGNGVFVRIQDGPQAGFVGETIGGALIHVDSCGPLGGCPGLVGLDSGGAGDYMATHPTAANGTFVRVADGANQGLIARAAGGALLSLTDCTALGGCPGPVDLDSGGFNDYKAAHSTPVNGTLLLGVPSNSTWQVENGERQPAGSSSSAVAVNDASLSSIPIASCPSGQTGTPPNCLTPPGSCPSGQTGTPPNCLTPPGSCPSGQTGTPPNCLTPLGSCPSGQTGTPPNCVVPQTTACVVPRLKHMTLRQAKLALLRAHCRLGRVHRARHVRRHHALRVVSQSARARSTHPIDYRLGITLG